MAEKIFTNVRLGLKVDTLENWQSSSLVLKRGEVAFATIAASAGTGLTEPVCMMKIGDGEHTFAQLGFDFYAKASDVLAAAKSESALTAFVKNVIDNAGIATSDALTALTGRVTTAEGKITTAEGKITALEGLVGDGKVSDQISNAIAALKLSETYAAKVHTHAKADITDFAHTHAISEVTDLQNQLDAAKKAGTDADAHLEAYKLTNDKAVKDNADAIAAINAADTGILAQAKTYADGKDTAIAAAKKAGDDAQAAVDTLAGKVGTVPAEKTVVGMIAEAQAAATYDDTQIKKDIKANADAIGVLEGYVGGATVSSQIQTAITNLNLATTYEAKGAAAAVKTELVGVASDTDASATIAGAKKYADKLDAAMDARVDVLEAAVGEGGSVATQIATEIQKLDATVETAAILEGQDGIYVKVTEVDGKLTAVEATIEVSNEINAVKTKLEGKIGTVAEGKTLAGLVAENAAAIQAHKDAVDAKVTTLIGTDTGKSVRAIANEELAAQLIPENAAESLDTLQEIAAWIQAHPGDASAMNAAIEALQTKVGDTTVAAQIEASITALKNGDIKSAVDRIVALEGKSHEHANKVELDKIAEGDKAKWDAAADKAHTHANATELAKFVDGDKAKLDTAVQTVTAGTGLKATKTGTDVAVDFDDTVVWILDCGTSAV